MPVTICTLQSSKLRHEMEQLPQDGLVPIIYLLPKMYHFLASIVSLCYEAIMCFNFVSNLAIFFIWVSAFYCYGAYTIN